MKLSEMGLSSKKGYLIENLATLVDAGINISESLFIISSGVKNKAFKSLIGRIKEGVDAGFSLCESFKKTNIFSNRDISLIMIGESSGRLAENLNILSLQHQKEKFFRYKVYSALMYPALVLFMMLVIGVGMSWFLLPKLSVVFTQLDAKLPFITRVMISVGNFFGSYGAIFFPIFSFILFLYTRRHSI
jgi:type II secretory pathway component PulF